MDIHLKSGSEVNIPAHNSRLLFLSFNLIVLLRVFLVTNFFFQISACGVNRSAQFTAKGNSRATEENLSKEAGPPDTEVPLRPVGAAVAPEMEPNPLSHPPASEPLLSSTPISTGGKQEAPSKPISGEDAPSVPPTAISGSFLLECLVSKGINDIPFVSVLCRVLKGGVVQPSVGTLPADWQISSNAPPITWGSVAGINVPSLPGVWNSDFSLPADNYIGRGVRVKNPEGPTWIETTLQAIDSPTPNGFASLASLGIISLGGTAYKKLEGCTDAVVNAKILGSGIRTFLKVQSGSGTVAVSLRGLCGSNFVDTRKKPGRLIVKSTGSNSIIFEQPWQSESFFSTGPLSLKEGTYEISFETIYNPWLLGDPYDNIGFTSISVLPVEGVMSSSTFEFFTR